MQNVPQGLNKGPLFVAIARPFVDTPALQVLRALRRITTVSKKGGATEVVDERVIDEIIGHAYPVMVVDGHFDGLWRPQPVRETVDLPDWTREASLQTCVLVAPVVGVHMGLVEDTAREIYRKFLRAFSKEVALVPKQKVSKKSSGDRPGRLDMHMRTARSVKVCGVRMR